MGKHERSGIQPVTRSVRDDLFLVAHDDPAGLWRRYQPRINTAALGAGLAGGVLVDLVLADQVRVEGTWIAVHTDRVPLPEGRDPIGEEILGRLAAGGGWHGLRDVVASLGQGLYDRTAAQLIETKVLHATARRGGRVKFWPADDTHASSARLGPRLRIRNITKGWPETDPVTDAVCALITVLRLEDGLYLDIDADEVTRRIESIGHWLHKETEYDQRLAAIPAITTAVDAVIGDLAVAVYR